MARPQKRFSVFLTSSLRFTPAGRTGIVRRSGDIGVCSRGAPMSTREAERWASTAGTVVLAASFFAGLFAVGAAIAGLLV